MYLGDSTYYTSYRQSLFRDYEKFPYGTLEGNSKPQKSHYAKVQGKLFFFFFIIEIINYI